MRRKGDSADFDTLQQVVSIHGSRKHTHVNIDPNSDYQPCVREKKLILGTACSEVSQLSGLSFRFDP